MKVGGEMNDLTSSDFQMLSELDSRKFGFLKLNETQHERKKKVVQKAIDYLENLIICANNNNKGGGGGSEKVVVKKEDEVTPPCDSVTSDGDVASTLASQTTILNEFLPSDCHMGGGGGDDDDDDGKNSPSTEEKEEEEDSGTAIHPKTYCKLGHLYLLLEDYQKALSAYQKYNSLRPHDFWKDVTFLYGQGLVYFHYNAFQWAIKSFRQVLYIEPSFSRANEVHLRLGLMFKFLGDYNSSLKHYQLALIDSGICSFSHLEIRFHIAHVYELQAKHRTAKEEYESLLQEDGLPNSVRSDILRQLGWMYHTVESLGEKSVREDTAVQYLLKSTEADPESGQSRYLLGRCYSSLGRVYEAFRAYRDSVDKCECNADTWCSIGVLYQQQNQPLDALQAYICAVKFDRNHTSSWTNLGILYESYNFVRDALACYSNATESAGKHVNPNLAPRIKFLQEQLANAPFPNETKPRNILMSIEDAWNTTVSTDMSGRQQQSQVSGQQRISINQSSALHKYSSVSGPQPPPPYPSQGNDAKRFKHDLAPERTRPQFYLTQQQLQQLQYLEENQGNLNPQQLQQLHALQYNRKLMQQHHLQLRQQQPFIQQHQNPPEVQASQISPAVPQTLGYQNSQGVYVAAPAVQTFPQPQQPVNNTGRNYMVHGPQSPSNNFNSTAQSSPSANSALYINQTESFVNEGGNASSTTNSSAYPLNGNGYGSTFTEELPKDLIEITPATTVSDQELQELISRKELTSLFMEDLMNRLNQGDTVIDEKGTDFSLNTEVSNYSVTTTVPSVTAKKSSGLQTSQSAPDMQGISAPFIKQEISETRMEPTILPPDCKPSLESMKVPLDCELKLEESLEVPLNINMTAAEVLEACKGLGSLARNMSMVSDKEPPPSLPDPPKIKLTNEQLLPPTPSVLLENKKLAFSPQLYEFCLQHPIAVVRGLASALKMDLGLFSTKTLVESNPDHTIEIRTQPYQDSDKNIDPSTGQVTWPFLSIRSFSVVSKYAQYQGSSFQESLKEEQDRVASGGQKMEDTKKKKSQKLLKFGTNVDLSDEKKWRLQLQELTKLPAFLRVVSAGNMLSHIGHSILGMNTVQLYMKVPGARTPGHQENNNFCSVNINIGPGDCEWFAVPDAYWGTIANLCEKNGTNYLHGSWWPDLQELYDENVPVYRFLQKPGVTVWVNAGCVHWVQAIGWCNNIAWNVGPLTTRQYQLALERYEWNKLQSFKSIVPMVHLSWNLARNIKVSDARLFQLIKGCLMRSLKMVTILLQFVSSCGLQPKFHGRAKNEPSHYCGMCEVEVFDVLFVKGQDRRHVVYCVDCARRQAPRLEGFVVLEEYHLGDLCQVYDNFVLHPAQPSQSSGNQDATPPA